MARTTWSQNSLALHGVPAQVPSTHQRWLFATQSQSTAAQCGKDPATQIFLTPILIAPCTWFQAACILHRSHCYQYSPMLHLLLCVGKWQLTTCFTQTDPCMLMSLSIHLHGSHPDVQYGQTCHLSTQLHGGKRTGRQLLWSTTLL